MRIKWAALLTSISFLLAATSVSAQGPVALSSPQLDGITPTYQLDPTQYQLRVAVDALTVADPDRVRDALLMEDPEESMAAQQMPGDEPEARCTPARRALLASAGRSESPAWQATPQQGSALTSAASNRQSPSTVIRLAATSPGPTIGAAASPAPTVRAVASRDEPAAIRNAGSTPRRAVVDSSRPAPARSAAAASKRAPAPTVRAVASRDEPAAIRNAGSTPRRAVVDSSRPAPARSAAAASKRAPAPTVASRAPKVEVPARTVRAAASRSPEGGAVRVASGANAADIVARVRSQVNRTLAAVPGGAFRLR